MKIVNEKGKLFGKINIVDLLAVLFILVVVIAVAWRIFGTSVGDMVSNVTSPKVDVTYTIRVPNVRKVIYDELVSFGFPQQLTADGSLLDANIVSATYEPCMDLSTDAQGNTKTTMQGDRVDIVAVIEAKVKPGVVITIGTQEIRIGKNHILKTSFFEYIGITETLDTDKTKFGG